MDSGYYVAMTGLVARTQALDTAAANLANLQTPGYRAGRDFFRSIFLDSDAPDSQLDRTINNYGVMGGTSLNLAQGALQLTGNPLDLALEGPGFFAIQTAHGPRYTRDGSFHRSSRGFVVTQADEPVLSSAGQPMLLPSGEVSVGSDGLLSVGGGAVTTIGVFTFPEAIALAPEGADRYVAPVGERPIQSQAKVRQGSLESSNEDVVQGTLELILVQRQAEMMQKALSVFQNDFNKFATEDLPRI
jgi:flagellar basal-body rod protein FlgF